jgi:uncharacterized protein (DUF486 family)
VWPGAHPQQPLSSRVRRGGRGICFFAGSYCFQVPANRIGYGQFTAFQLKIVQEVITLTVFTVFVYFYLGEGIKWNHAVSFAFLLGAVLFAFWGQR